MKPFSVAIIEMQVPFRSDILDSVPKFNFLNETLWIRMLLVFVSYSPIDKKSLKWNDDGLVH